MTAKDERRKRARRIRCFERPALEDLGYWAIHEGLDAIMSECSDVQYAIEDDDTLLDALDGDEDEAYEMRMAYSDICAKAEDLYSAIADCYMDEQAFDDHTVALLGNRYRMIDYGDFSEDYRSLTAYEGKLAQGEAGRRVMRETKAEMLASIGQAMGITLAYIDLRVQWERISAAMGILKAHNGEILKQVREIEAAYEAADAQRWEPWKDEVRKYDRLLAAMPARAWLE